MCRERPADWLAARTRGCVGGVPLAGSRLRALGPEWLARPSVTGPGSRAPRSAGGGRGAHCQCSGGAEGGLAGPAPRSSLQRRARAHEDSPAIPVASRLRPSPARLRTGVSPSRGLLLGISRLGPQPWRIFVPGLPGPRRRFQDAALLPGTLSLSHTRPHATPTSSVKGAGERNRACNSFLARYQTPPFAIHSGLGDVGVERRGEGEG